MSKFSGRVAWVTGAGRGIGRAAAFALAELGARVAVSARTQPEINMVTEEIRSRFGQVVNAFECDVSNWRMVSDVRVRISAQFGPPDILVNNAGMLGPLGNTWETDPTQWRRAVETNLLGAYHCVRAVLPDMISGGRGCIVNVSSVAASFPLSHWTAYASSKAGLDFFTKTLGTELKGKGTWVCCLYPGVVDTAMVGKLRTAKPEELPPNRSQYFEKLAARGELLSPEKVGKIIAWLAGNDGTALNGTVIDAQKEASLMSKALQEFEEWRA